MHKWEKFQKNSRLLLIKFILQKPLHIEKYYNYNKWRGKKGSNLSEVCGKFIVQQVRLTKNIVLLE
jgi:hypothetical protein